MDPRTEAVLEVGKGMVGCANHGSPRNVTLIERDAWQAAERDLGTEVDPVSRRANLMVEGISLRESRGRILRVGECLIEIRGETRPCEVMNEAAPGLRDALDPEWRAGAFGVVKQGGTLRLGDGVAWVEEEGP
jgi:MOSC domain-containing protein YiiM